MEETGLSRPQLLFSCHRHEISHLMLPQVKFQGQREGEKLYKKHVKAYIKCAYIFLCLDLTKETNTLLHREFWGAIDPNEIIVNSKADNLIINNSILTQFKQSILPSGAKELIVIDPGTYKARQILTGTKTTFSDGGILFYYNGHGVRPPTPITDTNGKIKGVQINFFEDKKPRGAIITTKTIVEDFVPPFVGIFDVSNAGYIVDDIKRRMESPEAQQSPTQSPRDKGKDKAVIVIGACARDEVLPAKSSIPSDLLTCCMTTPLAAFVYYYIKKSHFLDIDPLTAYKLIPGDLRKTQTPLGELDWILKTILEAIAWSLFDHVQFYDYFRQKSHLKSILCNYFVAQKVLGYEGLTPQIYPEIPDVSSHPLWQDMEDMIMYFFTNQSLQKRLVRLMKGNPRGCCERQQNEENFFPFLRSQLRGLVHWMNLPYPSRRPPHQLPIVKNILCTDILTEESMLILSRYFDLGKNAINEAMSLSIDNILLVYIAGKEKNHIHMMIFVYAKLIAAFPFLTSYLINKALRLTQRMRKDKTLVFSVIAKLIDIITEISTPPDERALTLFLIYSVLCVYDVMDIRQKFPQLCVEYLIVLLNSPYTPVKCFSLLCLSKLLISAENRKTFLTNKFYKHIKQMSFDASPEVRGCSLVCISSVINNIPPLMIMDFINLSFDPSPLVRREALYLVKRIIVTNFEAFLLIVVKNCGLSIGVNVTKVLNKELMTSIRSVIDYGDDDNDEDTSPPCYDGSPEPEKTINETAVSYEGSLETDTHRPLVGLTAPSPSRPHHIPSKQHAKSQVSKTKHKSLWLNGFGGHERGSSQDAAGLYGTASPLTSESCSDSDLQLSMLGNRSTETADEQTRGRGREGERNPGKTTAPRSVPFTSLKRAVKIFKRTRMLFFGFLPRSIDVDEEFSGILDVLYNILLSLNRDPIPLISFLATEIVRGFKSVAWLILAGLYPFNPSFMTESAFGVSSQEGRRRAKLQVNTSVSKLSNSQLNSCDVTTDVDQPIAEAVACESDIDIDIDPQRDTRYAFNPFVIQQNNAMAINIANMVAPLPPGGTTPMGFPVARQPFMRSPENSSGSIEKKTLIIPGPTSSAVFKNTQLNAPRLRPNAYPREEVSRCDYHCRIPFSLYGLEHTNSLPTLDRIKRKLIKHSLLNHENTGKVEEHREMRRKDLLKSFYPNSLTKVLHPTELATIVLGLFRFTTIGENGEINEIVHFDREKILFERERYNQLTNDVLEDKGASKPHQKRVVTEDVAVADIRSFIARQMDAEGTSEEALGDIACLAAILHTQRIACLKKKLTKYLEAIHAATPPLLIKSLNTPLLSASIINLSAVEAEIIRKQSAINMDKLMHNVSGVDSLYLGSRIHRQSTIASSPDNQKLLRNSLFPILGNVIKGGRQLTALSPSVAPGSHPCGDGSQTAREVRERTKDRDREKDKDKEPHQGQHATMERSASSSSLNSPGMSSKSIGLSSASLYTASHNHGAVSKLVSDIISTNDVKTGIGLSGNIYQYTSYIGVGVFSNDIKYCNNKYPKLFQSIINITKKNKNERCQCGRYSMGRLIRQHLFLYIRNFENFDFVSPAVFNQLVAAGLIGSQGVGVGVSGVSSGGGIGSGPGLGVGMGGMGSGTGALAVAQGMESTSFSGTSGTSPLSTGCANQTSSSMGVCSPSSTQPCAMCVGPDSTQGELSKRNIKRLLSRNLTIGSPRDLDSSFWEKRCTESRYALVAKKMLAATFSPFKGIKAHVIMEFKKDLEQIDPAAAPSLFGFNFQQARFLEDGPFQKYVELLDMLSSSIEPPFPPLTEYGTCEDNLEDYRYINDSDDNVPKLMCRTPCSTLSRTLYHSCYSIEDCTMIYSMNIKKFCEDEAVTLYDGVSTGHDSARSGYSFYKIPKIDPIAVPEPHYADINNKECSGGTKNYIEFLDDVRAEVSRREEETKRAASMTLVKQERGMMCGTFPGHIPGLQGMLGNTFQSVTSKIYNISQHGRIQPSGIKIFPSNKPIIPGPYKPPGLNSDPIFPKQERPEISNPDILGPPIQEAPTQMSTTTPGTPIPNGISLHFPGVRFSPNKPFNTTRVKPAIQFTTDIMKRVSERIAEGAVDNIPSVQDLVAAGIYPEPSFMDRSNIAPSQRFSIRPPVTELPIKSAIRKLFPDSIDNVSDTSSQSGVLNGSYYTLSVLPEQRGYAARVRQLETPIECRCFNTAGYFLPNGKIVIRYAGSMLTSVTESSLQASKITDDLNAMAATLSMQSRELDTFIEQNTELACVDGTAFADKGTKGSDRAALSVSSTDCLPTTPAIQGVSAAKASSQTPKQNTSAAAVQQSQKTQQLTTGATPSATAATTPTTSTAINPPKKTAGTSEGSTAKSTNTSANSNANSNTANTTSSTTTAATATTTTSSSSSKKKTTHENVPMWTTIDFKTEHKGKPIIGHETLETFPDSFIAGMCFHPTRPVLITVERVHSIQRAGRAGSVGGADGDEGYTGATQGGSGSFTYNTPRSAIGGTSFNYHSLFSSPDTTSSYNNTTSTNTSTGAPTNTQTQGVGTSQFRQKHDKRHIYSDIIGVHNVRYGGMGGSLINAYVSSSASDIDNVFGLGLPTSFGRQSTRATTSPGSSGSRFSGGGATSSGIPGGAGSKMTKIKFNRMDGITVNCFYDAVGQPMFSSSQCSNSILQSQAATPSTSQQNQTHNQQQQQQAHQQGEAAQNRPRSRHQADGGGEGGRTKKAMSLESTLFPVPYSLHRHVQQPLPCPTCAYTALATGMRYTGPKAGHGSASSKTGGQQTPPHGHNTGSTGDNKSGKKAEMSSSLFNGIVSANIEHCMINANATMLRHRQPFTVAQQGGGTAETSYFNTTPPASLVPVNSSSPNSVLLVGCTDGNIRVYKNYDNMSLSSGASLVSAWYVGKGSANNTANTISGSSPSVYVEGPWESYQSILDFFDPLSSSGCSSIMSNPLFKYPELISGYGSVYSASAEKWQAEKFSSIDPMSVLQDLDGIRSSHGFTRSIWQLRNSRRNTVTGRMPGKPKLIQDRTVLMSRHVKNGVFAAYREPEIMFYDCVRETRTGVYNIHCKSGFTHIDCDNEGNILYYGTEHGDVFMCDTRDSVVPMKVNTHKSRILTVGYNSSSRTIISVSCDGAAKVVDVRRPATECIQLNCVDSTGRTPRLVCAAVHKQSGLVSYGSLRQKGSSEVTCEVGLLTNALLPLASVNLKSLMQNDTRRNHWVTGLVWHPINNILAVASASNSRCFTHFLSLEGFRDYGRRQYG